MRTALLLAFAAVALAGCETEVVEHQPPANVTVQAPPAPMAPAPVMVAPSSSSTTRTTTTTYCPPGSVC